MRASRTAAVAAAMLVVGLVVGNLASASAATSTTTSTNPVVSCGLRMGQSVRDAGGRLADVVAALTGKSVTDVQAERTAGKSFEQIAAESGVTADQVTSKALDIRAEVLAARVAAGTLTQEQADAAESRMATRVRDRVTSTAAGCTGAAADGTCDGSGTGAGGGMMGRGGRGMMGGAGGCGGTCTNTTTQQ